MAADQATPLTPDDETLFKDIRHDFLRVTSQGQTRLTVSTFLTGLTFAAFGALLAAPPVVPTTASPLSLDQVLFALSGTLMSIATLLFLLVTASTYAALLLLGNVSPSATKNLTDGTPHRLDPHDVQRLRDACAIYMTPSHWIPWGLVVLLASLPVIGWRTNPYIGGVTALVLAILGSQLGLLLRVAVGGVRRQPQ